MSALAKRARAARLLWVEVEPGKEVQFLLPAANDLTDVRTLAAQNALTVRLAQGWRGFTFQDFVPDGDDSPVEFDAEAFAEWYLDRPDAWHRVSARFIEVRAARQARRDALLGNSGAPSESPGQPGGDA